MELKEETNNVLIEIFGNKDVPTIVHKFLSYTCPQCKKLYYNKWLLITCENECGTKFCVNCVNKKTCKCNFCSQDFNYLCKKCC